MYIYIYIFFKGSWAFEADMCEKSHRKKNKGVVIVHENLNKSENWYPLKKKNSYSGKMHNSIKNYFQNMILALRYRVADFNSNTMKKL